MICNQDDYLRTLEEFITCKICMSYYDNELRKPLCLSCGHTFCAKCLRQMFHKRRVGGRSANVNSFDLRRSQTSQVEYLLGCPFDKSQHTYEDFAKIPPNFAVLSYI